MSENFLITRYEPQTINSRDIRKAFQIARDMLPSQIRISVDFGCQDPGVCDAMRMAEKAADMRRHNDEFRERAHREVVAILKEWLINRAQQDQEETETVLAEAKGETDE